MGAGNIDIIEKISDISQKVRKLNSYYAKKVEKTEHIGIDNNEILVLSLLIKNKDTALNMKQISEMTGVHPSILSGVLKELEFKKKYVERWRDQTDLRALYVKLTKEGIEAIQGYKSLTEEIFLKILSRLSEEEREFISKAADMFNEKTGKILQELEKKEQLENKSD